MSASPTDVQPVMDAGRGAGRPPVPCACCAHPARRGAQLVPLADYHRPTAAPRSRSCRCRCSGHRSAAGPSSIARRSITPTSCRCSIPSTRPRAQRDGRGLRAVLAVPLMHEGEALGAIFLWRREPELFTPDQVALVETFATQAAIAIEQRAPVPRHAGSTRAADGDQRNPARHQQFADRRAAGVRHHRRQRACACATPPQRHISIRWRTRFTSPRSAT